jgi:hypothetical protein
MAIIKLKAKCFSAPEFNQNALPYLQPTPHALLKNCKKSQELTEREHKDLGNFTFDFHDLLPERI